MPIEIRELVIKTTINKDLSDKRGGGLSEERLAKLKRDLKRECVQEMNRILERRLRR